jgi:uncharacterized protein
MDRNLGGKRCGAGAFGSGVQVPSKKIQWNLNIYLTAPPRLNAPSEEASSLDSDINSTEANRFQILALSGGGFRGLYTAKVLADFEQVAGKPIAQCFDLLAGTSIGGILALALAQEIPAERMVRLFEMNGDKIFKKRRSFLGFIRSPYTQDGLSEILGGNDLFGEKTLGSSKHRVIVPAINYTTGRPVIFKTAHNLNFVRDFKHRLIDIALATSAAPAYFPRHLFDNTQYVDGGLFANAPGLLAIHEAECFLGVPVDQIRLVSVGTMSANFTVDPRKNRAGGMIDWGGWKPAETPKRLFGLAISAQESLAHFQLGHRLKSGHYFRVDADLTDARARAVALDKVDAAAQQVLLGAASDSSKQFLGQECFRMLLMHVPTEPQFFKGTANA